MIIYCDFDCLSGQDSKTRVSRLGKEALPIVNQVTCDEKAFKKTSLRVSSLESPICQNHSKRRYGGCRHTYYKNYDSASSVKKEEQGRSGQLTEIFMMPSFF